MAGAALLRALSGAVLTFGGYAWRMEPETSELQTRTMRSVAARLMPVLLGLYIIAYLDRVNVTFAQDRLESDLGFSGAVYGFGAGVFFIAYFFFEVPSNLALHRFGARRWIARIMVTWGIISACTMFVQGPLSFYVVRFLLGIAEAGFFPGMILYLSFWFPARERARAVGFFMSAIAISYAIGAPVSGGIMSVFDDVAGLQDWQWLFLIEAIPALLAGVFVLWFLDDGPEHATWLPDDEKRWLAQRLEGEEEVRLTRERHTLGEVFKDARVLAFGVLYFCMVVNVYGISFWVAEIVDQIDGLSDVAAGFVTAIPYTVAIVGLVLISRRSDRTGERKLHVAVPLALGAVAFARLHGRLARRRDRGARRRPVLPARRAPRVLVDARRAASGAAAAAGIALINSVGNLGGFVEPYLVGLMKDATGSTDGGLITLAAILAFGAFLATRVAHDPALERAPRREHGPLHPRGDRRHAGTARHVIDAQRPRGRRRRDRRHHRGQAHGCGPSASSCWTRTRSTSPACATRA